MGVEESGRGDFAVGLQEVVGLLDVVLSCGRGGFGEEEEEAGEVVEGEGGGGEGDGVEGFC